MKKNKLREDIDYGNYPERMGRSTERAAADPNSLYATNPAMKRGAADVEKLIGNRFKKVVDYLRQVTNIQDLSSRQVQGMLFNEMMSNLVPSVIQIEDNHKEEIQQLAIEASLDETEVPAEWYEIEAQLIRAPIDPNEFRMQPDDDEEDQDQEDDQEDDDNNEQPEIPSFDIEDLTPDEQLELEKHKRNIINALIQGAAKKGHHIYDKPWVKERLDQIDPNLHAMYKKIMAITDFNYFTMDDAIDAMSQSGSGIAGMNKLSNPDEDGGDEGGGDEGGGGEPKPDTKITALGLFFPILCHEIVKGIKEASGRHGLPNDPEMSQKIRGKTDVLSNEPMQLRVGPELFEKLRFLLPDEMFDESNKGLTPWFEMVLYQIPAQEFLTIIGNIVTDDERKNNLVKTRFREVMREAMNLKSEYDDYKEDNNIPPDSDDKLGDWLNSMGIDLPS
jgi:hypothetical protein